MPADGTAWCLTQRAFLLPSREKVPEGRMRGCFPEHRASEKVDCRDEPGNDDEGGIRA